MQKTTDYKPTAERSWREQAFPLHPLLIELQARIGAYLGLTASALLPPKISLSAVIEASINFAYQQWIERGVEYADDLHDKGTVLYTVVTTANPVKQQCYPYLKATTVTKIDLLGDFLEISPYYTPRLYSRRSGGVYNRKLIIILCMNALGKSLKA